MKYTTDWEEIGLSNDFIFGKVYNRLGRNRTFQRFYLWKSNE